MTVPFAAEARLQFETVARRFGLTCVSSTEHAVRYENDSISLIVNFDNSRSYELGVEIEKSNSSYPGPPFTLAEILRLKGEKEAGVASSTMVSDTSSLRDALKRAAELAVKHAADFLAGNDFSFAQVAKLRERESGELELNAKLRHARIAAEAAWANKDFAAVVKALEVLEPHLSAGEKTRLTYSRKLSH